MDINRVYVFIYIYIDINNKHHHSMYFNPNKIKTIACQWRDGSRHTKTFSITFPDCSDNNRFKLWLYPIRDKVFNRIHNTQFFVFFALLTRTDFIKIPWIQEIPQLIPSLSPLSEKKPIQKNKTRLQHRESLFINLFSTIFTTQWAPAYNTSQLIELFTHSKHFI